MKLLTKKFNCKGFGILEGVLSTALASMLVFFISMQMHLYNLSTVAQMQVSAIEDAKSFVRENLSCENTLTPSVKLRCAGSGNYIDARDKLNGRVIVDEYNPSNTLKYIGSNVAVRAHCSTDSSDAFYRIKVEVAKAEAGYVGMAGTMVFASNPLTKQSYEWRELSSGIPLTCPKTPPPSLPSTICGYPVAQLNFPVGPHHLIFYTDTFFDGNLGGLSGADAKCQAEAERPGSVVNVLKPGARWRAFLARSGKTLPDIGISFQGDVYAIPMVGQSVAPRNNFSKIILKNGTMVGGRPPTQFCNYPHVCNSAIVGFHGGYHHWTGAWSDGSVAVGLNCTDWTTNVGSATAGDGGWGADWPDRFYDGGYAIHACSYKMPLGCISE